jgi:hypothetical protein
MKYSKNGEYMNPKKSATNDWLGDALDPVMGKKLTRFNYRKASKRRGTRFDRIELHFAGGKVTISPDPVGKELELVAWFTPDRK